MRSTGVPGLDIPLEGGFPFGSIIIVAGTPLSGIDNLARQFWIADEGKGSYFMIDAEVEESMIAAREMDPLSIAGAISGNRIVIDSISSIILRFGIDSAMTCIHAIKKEIGARGANAILLYYTDVHPAVEEIQVMRAADVFIELKAAVFMNELERQLAVHKIRGNAVPKRLIPFNITEKGIELSTTSRVV